MKSVRKIHFGMAENLSNSTKPVLLYRGVVGANAAEKPKLFRERFKEDGWPRLWADTTSDYPHFHSNAYEVLGIARGNVSIRLGGEKGPS